PAAVSERFLVMLDPAERNEGAPPRLHRIEPRLADESLRLQLDVEPDLFVEPRFGGAAGEQEARACAGPFEPAHGSSLLVAPTIAERRIVRSCAERLRDPRRTPARPRP